VEIVEKVFGESEKKTEFSRIVGTSNFTKKKYFWEIEVKQGYNGVRIGVGDSVNDFDCLLGMDGSCFNFFQKNIGRKTLPPGQKLLKSYLIWIIVEFRSGVTTQL